MSKVERVLVVGGGIAGLTLATGLRQQGVAAEIVEIQDDWQPDGAGMILWANAVRALLSIDIVDDLRANSWPSANDALVILDIDGGHLADIVYPRLAGPDIPSTFIVKRLALHEVLVRGARKAGVPVRLGTTVERIDDDPSAAAARVTFTDGTAGDYDVVVATDGYRSHIRTLVFGENPPVFTGHSSWRTIVRRPPDVTSGTMMMGVGQRMGLMPVNDEELYMFGVSNEPDNPRVPEDKLDVLMKEKFAGFGGHIPALFEQVTGPEQVIYLPMDEVHQPPPWFKGRVVLISDAAHASTPHLALGASMGIEDCVVLTGLLVGDRNLADKLAAFMERRFKRCMIIQEASRKAGQDGQAEDPETCARRNAMIREGGMQKMTDGLYAMLAQDI